MKTAERSVVKVGTDSMTSEDGSLCVDTMGHIASEVGEVGKNTGQQIAIVSSGAVAAGRSVLGGRELRVLRESEDSNPDIEKKRMLASIGQNILIRKWSEIFASLDDPRIVGELLTLHGTFNNLDQIDNFETLMENLFRNGLIPIINANDALSSEPLKTSDNDVNASKVAERIKAQRLVICTNVDGLFEANPDTNPDAKLVTLLRAEDITDALIDELCSGKSTVGTGGMRSKLDVARRIARKGITTHIIRGGINHLLSKALTGQQFKGTTISPV